MQVKALTLFTAAISAAFVISGCKEAEPSGATAKPPSVPVAEVVVRPITPFVEFTGSLTAVKRVELRPRVAGYLQEVTVPEGRLVSRGDKPRPGYVDFLANSADRGTGTVRVRAVVDNPDGQSHQNQ